MGRLLVGSLSLLLVSNALAAPEVGGRLPDFRARNVNGEVRSLGELLQGGPTLLVAITDRGAGDAMQAIFEAADERGWQGNRVSIISVGVPFFISDDDARGRARGKVPERWRDHSLFDAQRGMAKVLGLGEGKTPWIFVVDESGRVTARAHGMPNDPEAEEIWQALGLSSVPEEQHLQHPQR